ncbi:hypothetical protein NDU88_002098 [Pleurodeles waltl]|uniref:Uncharacterized protein n=1 Tax=Pleurodeles waltl TaxID=8319 RepID=A0AAV7UBC0_PLEWA|nr:hypothetical protein NDU88_002098 [Pleurodeles waltl]
MWEFKLWAVVYRCPPVDEDRHSSKVPDIRERVLIFSLTPFAVAQFFGGRSALLCVDHGSAGPPRGALMVIPDRGGHLTPLPIRSLQGLHSRYSAASGVCPRTFTSSPAQLSSSRVAEDGRDLPVTPLHRLLGLGPRCPRSDSFSGAGFRPPPLRDQRWETASSLCSACASVPPGGTPSCLDRARRPCYAPPPNGAAVCQRAPLGSPSRRPMDPILRRLPLRFAPGPSPGLLCCEGGTKSTRPLRIVPSPRLCHTARAMSAAGAAAHKLTGAFGW